jgi:3',5'-cyclic AMP phosphodiesterase CpdA
MLSRRTALLAIAAAAAGWAADAPAVEFAHLSDIHIAKFKTAHPGMAKELDPKKDGVAHFFRALETLRRDVAPSFLLITGDLSDAYGYQGANGQMVYGQFEVFKSIFDRSPIPIFPMLGNHDITQYRVAPGKAKADGDQSIAGDARREWRRLIPNFRESTYYAFHKTAGATDYLFLVLDDGDGPGLNAGYVAEQLAWIKEQIAAHPQGPIVLAMHIPLQGADFWPGLKPVLADAPNVVLSIAGHKHTDGMDYVDLGSRKLVEVRTAALFMSDGNWRKMRLREDRIEIFATGRKDRIEKTVDANPAGALARKLPINPVANAQVPLGAGPVLRLP